MSKLKRKEYCIEAEKILLKLDSSGKISEDDKIIDGIEDIELARALIRRLYYGEGYYSEV